MRLSKDISIESPQEVRQWVAEVSRLFDNLGKIKKVRTATGTIDFPSIAANSNNDQTMSLSGVTAGTHNAVLLGVPATVEPELTITSFVSDTDEITIRAHNTSIGAVNPASNTYRVVVVEIEE